MAPLLSPFSRSPSPTPSYSSSRSTPPSPLPLWSPPRLYDKSKNASSVSLTELAASSTRSKLSKLLRPRALLAMFLAVVMIVGYVFAHPASAATLKRLPSYTGDGFRSSNELEMVDSTTTTPYSDRTHLIVVAGHGIWKGGPMLGEIDDEWTLEPYQKGHNESLTWIEHIEQGVEVLLPDREGLLVFSGGETRPASGPRTEAQSYWSLAEARGLLTPHIFSVSTTEIFARDSYENLLFSICRFKEYTGGYPESITVIGYEFKRHRFSHIHRAAIRFPEEKFTYIGIDPPNATLVAEMTQFERSQSLAPFEKDPYACFDDVLITKKSSRGWARRGAGGYESTCPELQPLLRHCGLQKDGTVQYFNGPLPWTR